MSSTLQTIGDYEVLEKIAEGGMGSVWKARDPRTGDLVAIKVVSQHLTNNKILLKRFEQEYYVASSLEHPGIVRALGFGMTGVCPYLVMEYVEGESLGAKIDRFGKMPERESVRIIVQVAEALQKAHKEGLVHRDVKPDNVLINDQGQAKLADLGLVKELETDLNFTRTGRGLGTPHFMAPEQFRNAKNADARCDIYSLGATLYMMVTGELPFKSLGPLEAWMKKIENKLTPAKEINPQVSERVDWAIRRSMQADPKDRPSCCQEFIEDLTGQSTRRINPVKGLQKEDIWFLRYKDEEGVIHTVKGTTATVRRSLKDGLLGDTQLIRASRNKSGPFENLKNHPEFRDLIIAAATNTDDDIPTKQESVPPTKTMPPLAKAEAIGRTREKGPAAVPTPNRPPNLGRQVAPNRSPQQRPEPRARPTPPMPLPHRRVAPAPLAPPSDPNRLQQVDLSGSFPQLPPASDNSATEWVRFVMCLLLALLVGMLGFFLLPYFQN